ncbi:lipoprotein insertase outer membrane protein LolB [Massilia sp. LXY-6]|uniref:lipoprotein insertase outer membrane protein LolB n=1 Tax=Massilia sp. LXY-6 TaxID=3379823 RepID=UPI003EDFB36B
MPLHRSLPLAFAAAAILSLAGCATPTSTANLSTATLGAYRDTIDLTGRLSVDYQRKGEPGRGAVTYTWAQHPGRIDVSLSGPVSTLAEITVTPDSATLKQANRAPRTARDIDTLTQQELGWSLPIGGLRDWLQGYATDAQGKRFAASPANSEVFTNDGWRLRFAEWQAGPGNTVMPKRIRAGRSATATSDELAISITIDPVR